MAPPHAAKSRIINDYQDLTWGRDVHYGTREFVRMRVWTRLLTGFVAVALALAAWLVSVSRPLRSNSSRSMT